MSDDEEMIEQPFDMLRAREVLQRTPATLTAMLGGISAARDDATEGGDSWSPYVVVGHLIHGERTDWIPWGRGGRTCP